MARRSKLKVLCHQLFIAFVLLSLPSKTSTAIDHSQVYEQHVTEMIAHEAPHMQNIWNERRGIFFNYTKGHNFNEGLAMDRIEAQFRQMARNWAINLSTVPIVKLKNETLRRQVKLLSKLQFQGLNDKDYEKAKSLMIKMRNFVTASLVPPLSGSESSKPLAMVPDIVKEIIRIKNIRPLNDYWFKWRSAINATVARRNFLNYIRLLRKAAMYNGHITPSRTWYLNFETENFQKELEDIVWEIMPLYKELHAYVRHTARLAYDKSSISSDGAIPAPVLEQMIQQAWFNSSILTTPYPRKKLPAIQMRLEEKMVQANKMMKKASEFLESLGLHEMSSEFYTKFTRVMSNNENLADCKSRIYHFPPDVALRYCSQLNYKKLMQMHGNMVELQYHLYTQDLPLGLDSEPCPGFSSAIGETAVIASGTPRHLFQLHILANDSLDEENAMNRQFRMAVHTILAIPQYFINDKFLVDVLDGHIAEKNLNCGYWELQYKYAGVEPPIKRNEKFFDPDYKFYRGLNVASSNIVKFLSEVLGMQFYRHFCLASKQYRPGDPKYPLHNCDFYGSEKVGTMIKDMMKLGATKHWREVLAAGIGETKLSSRGVIEYFAPLYTWLRKKNKKLGVDVGWDSKIKCIKS